VPLEIQMGSADDWTPPEPCQDLAVKWNVPITMYPEAFHGFDAPDVPIRVRTGLATSKNGDGRAHVGTHPESRARLIAAVMGRLKAVFDAP
jgi:dienelactone hydrolase